ncbi:MAG: hypothetical protein IJW42_00305 [Alistipes sp.]|nr:hypothetical protein [Alistipes sp.]
MSNAQKAIAEQQPTGWCRLVGVGACTQTCRQTKTDDFYKSSALHFSRSSDSKVEPVGSSSRGFP